DRLNAARYTDFLETDFFDYLEDIHLQQRIEVWFQLDGCLAHYNKISKRCPYNLTKSQKDARVDWCKQVVRTHAKVYIDHKGEYFEKQ
ncbi:hypothetical protein ALC60_10780, partial [Trachymyrmex zeteki]